MKKYNCRYFLADKPCKYHKQSGATCSTCGFFSRVNKRILIIKLGSSGDVLRTTFILKSLRDKYKDAAIWWLTLPEAVPLLSNNPFIDRTLEYGFGSYTELSVNKFDVLINLDIDRKSTSLATLITADTKLGFGMSTEGQIVALNTEAQTWLSMSLDDKLKRENDKTFQYHMSKIINIDRYDPRPTLVLSKSELEEGKGFISRGRLDSNLPLVGLNLEAGDRWPKAWPKKYFLELAKKLSSSSIANVVLLRAPGTALDKSFLQLKGVVDAGIHTNVRRFASVISCLDLLVTADTLAMHISFAFNKKTVILFGPTASQEIDVFGDGKKIKTPLSCGCCYNTTCDVLPNCMESITPKLVYQQAQKLLAKEQLSTIVP